MYLALLWRQKGVSRDYAKTKKLVHRMVSHGRKFDPRLKCNEVGLGCHCVMVGEECHL